MTIIDYVVKKKQIILTIIIISMVNAIIIINGDLFNDYEDKKLKLSTKYVIHKVKVFITTFIISFISYIMCFYLFGPQSF